jgi:hypothetical protein
MSFPLGKLDCHDCDGVGLDIGLGIGLEDEASQLYFVVLELVGKDSPSRKIKMGVDSFCGLWRKELGLARANQ